MKTEIVEFHKTEIYCPIKDEQIYVAIKPICEAFSVDYKAQHKRLKRDQLWGQLSSTVTSVGRDDKARKMTCLPLQFVFGWIMTIDTNLVKEEIKDTLIAYKIECCQVLYHHFWTGRKASQRKEQYLSNIQQEIEALTEQRKKIRKTIKAKKAEFEKVALTPDHQFDLFLDQPSTQN